MEEKKLTDEELVKNIEYCMTHDDCSEDCPMCKVQGCILIMLEQSFDLIHRLQDESAKQKEEIERLTKENEEVWDERNRICKGYWETMDENAKQKAELEELHTLTDMQDVTVKKILENNNVIEKYRLLEVE